MMSNNIKEEMNKIEIPKDLHEVSKKGVIRAKSEQPRKKYKRLRNGMVAAVMVSVIAIGLLSSPVVQAKLEKLFTYEKVNNEEQVTTGWWFMNAGEEGKLFNSLYDVEEQFLIDIPFPGKFLEVEKNALSDDHISHNVSFTKDKFGTYRYDLRTDDRLYTFHATNTSKEKPQFTAKTTNDNVIEKEIIINDISATLMGIYDTNNRFIYLEKDEWKIVIDVTAIGVGDSIAEELSEQELIEIAESISW